MRTVVVSGRQVLIDDVDFDLFERSTWRLNGPSNYSYVCRYEKRQRKTVGIFFHREILGAPKDMCVDHINGNTLDNRRENLRLCTHAENMKNRKMHSNNRCGFKGVWEDRSTKRRSPFVAQIRVNGKRIQIGRFQTAELAHKAYLKAAAKLHGEFKRSSTR